MSNGFLLDTNVLSELMRERPAAAVLAWFARHTRAIMRTSSVTHAEILAGVALLPAGKRRTELAAAAEQMFEQDFAAHCIAFDASCAKHYAVIVASRTRQGSPISTEDAQIAAIALASGLPLVTRNTKDFAGIDALQMINPWQAETPH